MMIYLWNSFEYEQMFQKIFMYFEYFQTKPHVGLLYLLISMVQVLSPGLISNYQYDISWPTAFLKSQQPAVIKWYKPGVEHLCMESV